MSAAGIKRCRRAKALRPNHRLLGGRRAPDGAIAVAGEGDARPRADKKNPDNADRGVESRTSPKSQGEPAHRILILLPVIPRRIMLPPRTLYFAAT